MASEASGGNKLASVEETEARKIESSGCESEKSDVESEIMSAEEDSPPEAEGQSDGATERSTESEQPEQNSDESFADFSGEDEILKKSRRVRKTIVFGLFIPILMAFACSGLFQRYPEFFSKFTLHPNIPISGGGKSPVVHETKRASDWMQDLTEKGGQYRVLTDAEIKYDEGGPMYLVVAGHVFDVSSGGQMYAEDSGYHGFIGRDGTRAFVSGKFDEEGLTPDLKGLKPEDFKGISGWINFYLNHEKYKFVGILNGWFFDEMGKPTENLKELIKNVEIADNKEKAQMKIEEQFPTCNIEWTAEKGSRLWCSDASGGIKRTWIGVPRVFTERNDAMPRCACVRPSDLKDPRLSEYKGCPKKSQECKIKED